MDITADQCTVPGAVQGNGRCAPREAAGRHGSVAREVALGVERVFHRARLALARAL